MRLNLSTNSGPSVPHFQREDRAEQLGATPFEAASGQPEADTERTSKMEERTYKDHISGKVYVGFSTHKQDTRSQSCGGQRMEQERESICQLGTERKKNTRLKLSVKQRKDGKTVLFASLMEFPLGEYSTSKTVRIESCSRRD